MNQVLKKIWGTVSEFTNPFEILYLSVAVATFDHTRLTAATMFEGVQPLHGTPEFWEWLFRGTLIAIAVDVGMFVASREISKSKSRTYTLALIASFISASFISFFMQVGYIAMYGGAISFSETTPQYWRDFLMPLIEARYLIMPLALPFLATIYTISRVAKDKNRVVIEAELIESMQPETKKPAYKIEKPQEENLLEDGKSRKIKVIPPENEWVKEEELRFWDPKYGLWREYETLEAMQSGLERLKKRRGGSL